MNTIIGCMSVLWQACGSFPVPLCVTAKETCKLSGSTNELDYRSSQLVRDDILEDHERVSEVSLALQETTVLEALN